MNVATFELNVSLPAEPRYAHTMRALAAHAARYAGGTGSDVELYGAAVEAIARACLDQAASRAGDSPVAVPIIIRGGDGPVEVLIGCEEPFQASVSPGARITVGWTRERGGQMCRVALRLDS